MSKTRPSYQPASRQHMIKLVRSGRTPEDLPREIEPSLQTLSATRTPHSPCRKRSAIGSLPTQAQHHAPVSRTSSTLSVSVPLRHCPKPNAPAESRGAGPSTYGVARRTNRTWPTILATSVCFSWKRTADSPKWIRTFRPAAPSSWLAPASIRWHWTGHRRKKELVTKLSVRCLM